MHDVVIIGAGPAGSHLARCLAEARLDVLLLEEHARVGDGVICTGIIGEEAFERFDLSRMAAVGAVKDVRFISQTGKIVDYSSESPLATVVCRRRFDSGLAERAVEAGARLRTGTHVEEVLVEPRGVRLLLRCEGKNDGIRARMCVLATGYGSALIERLGFGQPRRLIQGAQAEIPFRDLKRTEVFLGSRYAPGGFGWAVPVGDGEARVGVVTNEDAPRFLRRILDRPDIRDRIGTDPARIQACPIPVGALQTTVSDRMMVVGEAAGQVKTTTQGGIYYGLLCAQKGARVTIEAFRSGDLSRAALLPYEHRWRARLNAELKLGLLLRQFYAELSDRQVDRLFDLASLEDVLPTIRRKALFDWHAPVIRSVLNRGFLASIVRSTLGIAPIGVTPPSL